MSDDLRSLLESVRTILLVDWPGPEQPAALVRAGYEVYGHEPDGFRRHGVAASADAGDPACRSFPLEGGEHLVSWMVASHPTPELVCTYRPPEEQPEIVATAIEAGARAFWVEEGAGGTSPDARSAAESAGLTFVDGASLGGTVTALGVRAAGGQGSIT